MSEMLARLGALERTVIEAVRLAEGRERTVDRLHDEVQRLRAGELQHSIAPIIRDLIQLHDTLEAAVARAMSSASPDEQFLSRELAVYQTSVLDILYRYGVERFTPGMGDPLNPKEHRVVGIVEADRGGADKTVATVVRSGFRSEARVVRPADVRAFRSSHST